MDKKTLEQAMKELPMMMLYLSKFLDKNLQVLRAKLFIMYGKVVVSIY